MIRRAERGDVAAVTAIYAQAVVAGTATFETVPPDEAEMARRFAAITAAGLPYLVAAAPAGVVGFAHASAFRERAAFRHTLEDSIYLREDARGRGVGTRLLDALVAAAAERGFRQMVAVIGDSANQASIRLHSKAGFAPVGRLPALGWKHGRWLDVVLMQRPLGEGAATPGICLPDGPT